MEKLKGLKRVNRIINEYLQRFGLSAEMANEFAYYTDTFSVNYTMTIVEEVSQYMLPFAYHLNPNVKADIFLVCLFHEIGHHFTQYNFSDAEWAASERIKEHIEKNYGKLEKKNAKWNNIYFNLPVEKAATEWGLNYMMNHYNEVEELWAELQPAILRFYRKNELI